MLGKQQDTLPEIRRTILLNAPIQKVWETVATSQGIAAWFMPNNFEPTLGFEFILQAGPFGESPCKVTELDPPKRLSFNWGKDWQITFELKELNQQTEFTLIHAGWEAEQVTEFGEAHTIVRDRMDQGWGGLLTKLKALVEG